MSVILNPPVHFYKPVECSKFVYEAPIVRSIFLEKDAVEIGEIFAFWRCPSQKKGNEMIDRTCPYQEALGLLKLSVNRELTMSCLLYTSPSPRD